MEDFEACSVMGGEAVQGSILGEGRAVKRAKERLRFYSSGREVVTKGSQSFDFLIHMRTGFFCSGL